MNKTTGKDKSLAMEMWRNFLIAITAGICTSFAGASLADDVPLSSDQGYMLIRISLNKGERIGTLAMSNVDTKEVIRSRTKSFEMSGSNAWMALVAMPSGRYFWSEYETSFGSSTDSARNSSQMYRRTSPGSASDSFEIVPGVVNYVGDWTMPVVASQQAKLDPFIEYDKSTLERYLAQYPEHANKYEIYLSVMGKAAISLQELAKITN
jgi:hypothetical protein